MGPCVTCPFGPSNLGILKLGQTANGLPIPPGCGLSWGGPRRLGGHWAKGWPTKWRPLAPQGSSHSHPSVPVWPGRIPHPGSAPACLGTYRWKGPRAAPHVWQAPNVWQAPLALQPSPPMGTTKWWCPLGLFLKAWRPTKNATGGLV
mgnify:CR=1 FL=1